jgi:large subunit ribosomal protein L4
MAKSATRSKNALPQEKASTVPLLDQSGKAVGKIDLPPAFAREPKVALLHFAVTRELANRRAGTADTKKRDEVRGGGRKPWRQKGTGRARHGSIRSPIWRKGGVVFGPHPRSYNIAMNRRARRAALAMAIGAKVADGTLSIIDASGITATKTKDFAALLWRNGSAQTERSDDARDRVLFVMDRQKDENATGISRAGGNLKRATILNVTEIGPHALLGHDRVILTKNAYEALAEVCGG